METILVVDEEAGFRTHLEKILVAEGYSVETTASATEAQKLGSQSQFHLVLASLELKDGGGLGILRWFGQSSPGTPVVMLKAAGSGDKAVQAMKLGAVGYVDKPLGSPDELRFRVRHALDDRLAEYERAVLREEGRARLACGTLIAQDPAMSEAVELAGKIARLEGSILITGPSGTGRETLARYIHGQSRRAGGAFVSVNCAATLPAQLESQLFGSLHPGHIERAEKGTLFLREVGELDGNLQSMLLRVLQERVFERPPDGRKIPVDARLMVCTRLDLAKMASSGAFREDLYDVLSTFRVTVPPLKERPADIPVLARCFLARAAQRLGKRNLELTQGALEAPGWSWLAGKCEGAGERDGESGDGLRFTGQSRRSAASPDQRQPSRYAGAKSSARPSSTPSTPTPATGPTPPASSASACANSNTA